MAKPNWLVVNPSTGSGNGTISNSSSEHTGRVARTGTVTVTGVGVSTPATYKVTQSPKAEFVSFDNGSEMSAPKTAGKVTVAGKSNSSKLVFSWLGEVTDVEIPATYKAGGVVTNNDAEIEGDPGASAQFAFSIELDFPLNDTVEEVERTLIVTANGGQASQILIKQAAGDARLEVSPKEITIPQSGDAVSVSVTSNTSWTVS